MPELAPDDVRTICNCLSLILIGAIAVMLVAEVLDA